MADGKLGVLADRELSAMFESGALKSHHALDDDQIQPASLDLRLGFEAHRIRASFLPGSGRSVADVLAE
ncbi:MAG: 2'-deoxycytidine 5'-triphosphate deaminase, partial [Pseudomonadota bacterium]